MAESRSPNGASIGKRESRTREGASRVGSMVSTKMASRGLSKSPPQSNAEGNAVPTPSSAPLRPRAAAVEGPRRVVYLALAAVFFGLAVLGALLPVLPTTPFLLLTSFLLMRSSPALNDRLLRSRTFGPLLQDWHRHRGVRPRVKAISIVFSMAAVALSAIYGNLPPLGLALLAGIAATGMVVLLRLPVIRDDPPGREP